MKFPYVLILEVLRSTRTKFSTGRKPKKYDSKFSTSTFYFLYKNVAFLLYKRQSSM